MHLLAVRAQARRAVEQQPARLVAGEGLAQDRQVALAVEAVAAMRVPGADDVVARLRPASPRRRPPRRRRRPRGRARSAADRRAQPWMTSRSVWQRPLARMRTSTSPGCSAAIDTVSMRSGDPVACSTAARNSISTLLRRGTGVAGQPVLAADAGGDLTSEGVATTPARWSSATGKPPGDLGQRPPQPGAIGTCASWAGACCWLARSRGVASAPSAA